MRAAMALGVGVGPVRDVTPTGWRYGRVYAEPSLEARSDAWEAGNAWGVELQDAHRPLFLAYHDGELVGVLAGALDEVDREVELRCAVHPAHRRRCVAMVMHEAAVEWAHRKRLRLFAVPGTVSGRAFASFWDRMGMEGIKWE